MTAESRVLVCEHDRIMAGLLTEILAAGGHQTDIVPNAVQAKLMLATNNYAAITVDLNLPGQDGLSFLRELRRQDPPCALPILAVSVKATDVKGAIHGAVCGLIDWLEKSIEHRRLAESIQRFVPRQPDRKLHVLYVEDDPVSQKIGQNQLRRFANVRSAMDMREAKHFLERDAFDVVILDLMLPDGDGTELLPHLQTASGRVVPVVVLSAYEVDADVARKTASVLARPLTSDKQLLASIQSLIQTVGQQ